MRAPLPLVKCVLPGTNGQISPEACFGLQRDEECFCAGGAVPTIRAMESLIPLTEYRARAALDGAKARAKAMLQEPADRRYSGPALEAMCPLPPHPPIEEPAPLPAAAPKERSVAKKTKKTCSKCGKGVTGRLPLDGRDVVCGPCKGKPVRRLPRVRVTAAEERAVPTDFAVLLEKRREQLRAEIGQLEAKKQELARLERAIDALQEDAA